MEEEKLNTDPQTQLEGKENTPPQPKGNGVDTGVQSKVNMAKDKYLRAKNALYSNKEFKRMDDEGKLERLGKFYDIHGVPYVKSAGVSDPNKINEFKDKFLEKESASLKSKKKEGFDLSEEKVEEKKRYVPDYLEADLDHVPSNYNPIDAIKPVPFDIEGDELLKETMEANQAEEAEELAQKEENVHQAVTDITQSERFKYVNDNPEGFLFNINLGEGKDVIKALRKDGYDKDVARAALNQLRDASSNKLVANNLRNLSSQFGTYQNLLDHAEQQGTPFIEGYQPGTFLDPETGERREPETDEEADYMGRMEGFMNNVTDKEKVEGLFIDAYAKYDYWNKRVNSFEAKKEDPSTATDYSQKAYFEAYRQRKNAEAEFQAASLMHLQNVGPADIEKDKDFKLGVFGTSFSHSMLGDNLTAMDDNSQREMLNKMVEIGQKEFKLTEEEMDALSVDFYEGAANLGGMLLPDVPTLMLLGGVSNTLKAISYTNRMQKGYKIIRNTVRAEKAGGAAKKVKAAKQVVSLKDAVPTGWEVIKEVPSTGGMKLLGYGADILINEMVFTGLGGFAPGTISGMHAAHWVLPNLKIGGKYGAMLMPYIDMVYKSGLGATVGMEAGGISAAAVDDLMGNSEFKEFWGQQYGDFSDAGQRVLAEVAVNSLVFGSMHLYTANSRKVLNNPIGNGNGVAYLSPKYRKRVYETAREADRMGYTDLAKDLDNWLDIGKQPVTGEAVRNQKIVDLTNLSKVMPDQTLKGTLRNIDVSLQALDALRNHPMYEKGDIFKKQELWPITIRYRNNEVVSIKTAKEEAPPVKGEGFIIIDAKKDMPGGVIVKDPFQANLMMEELLLQRKVFEHEVGIRNASGKFGQEKISATNKKPTPPGLPEGSDLPVYPDQTIAMKGDPKAGEKAAFKDNRFGIPSEVSKKTPKQLTEDYQNKRSEVEKQTKGMEDEIAKMEETRREQFKGRIVDNQQRKQRDQADEAIAMRRQEVDELKGSLNKEWQDVVSAVQGGVKDRLKEIVPEEALEESSAAVYNEVFAERNADRFGDMPYEKAVEEVIAEVEDTYNRPVVKEPTDKLVDNYIQYEISQLEKQAQEYPDQAEGFLQDIKDLKNDPVGYFKDVSELYKDEPLNPYKIEVDAVLGHLESKPKHEGKPIESKPAEEKVPPPEHADDVRWTLENETDPKEVKRLHDKLVGQNEERLEPWQWDLLSYKIDPNSFNRFADRNQVGMNLARNWFAKKGDTGYGTHEQLDVIAQEIGVEVQDIVDFIIANPVKKKATDNPDITDLARKYRELTGQPISKAEAKEEKAPASDKVQNIMELENINSLADLEAKKGMFEGFPFVKEEYDAVKKHLEQQPAKSSSPAAKKEVAPFTKAESLAFLPKADIDESMNDAREGIKLIENAEQAGLGPSNPVKFKWGTENILSGKGIELPKNENGQRYIESPEQVNQVKQALRDSEAMFKSELDRRKEAGETDVVGKGKYEFGRYRYDTIEEVKEAARRMEGRYPETLDIEVAKAIEAVEAERKAQAPKPEEKKPTTVEKPKEEKPTIKKPESSQTRERDDLDDDLDALSSLIDGIDKPFGAPGASATDPAQEIEINKAANRVVAKLIEKGDYRLPSIMSKLADRLEQVRLEAMFPYIKGQYGSYFTERATAKEADQMDIMEARNFQKSDIEKLYQEKHKPEKTESGVDPQTYVGKRYHIPNAKKKNLQHIEILRVEQWDDIDMAELKYGGPLFREKPEGQKILVAVYSDMSNVGYGKEGVAVDQLKSLIESGEATEMPPFEELDNWKHELGVLADLQLMTGNVELAKKTQDKIERGPSIQDQVNIVDGQPEWKRTVANGQASARNKLKAAKIHSGEILLKPNDKPSVEISEEDIVMALDKGRKQPIGPFLKNADPELFDKFVELQRESAWVQQQSGTAPYMAEQNYAMADYVSHFNVSKTPAHGDTMAYQQKAKELNYKDFDQKRYDYVKKIYKEGIQAYEQNINRNKNFLTRQKLKNMMINGERVDFRTVKNIADSYRLNLSDSELRETLEFAITERFRDIGMNRLRDVDKRFNDVVNFYIAQPSLGKLTSEAKSKQQYSTPAPMAFAMNEYVNGTSIKTIFDTTAGNGMLLVFSDNRGKSFTLDRGYNSGIYANEISEARARNLKELGFEVYNDDASKPASETAYSWGVGHADALALNPPFGTIPQEVIDGFKIKKLEHKIIMNAMPLMNDTGKAAIIVGEHLTVDEDGYITGDERYFYNWLSKNYNVEGIINIDGGLYSKMGTSFPVRMIFINGRKPVPESQALNFSQEHLKPKVTWPEVYETIKSIKSDPNESNLLRPGVDDIGRTDTSIRPKPPVEETPEESPGDNPIPVPQDRQPGEGMEESRPDATGGRLPGDVPPSVPPKRGRTGTAIGSVTGTTGGTKGGVPPQGTQPTETVTGERGVPPVGGSNDGGVSVRSERAKRLSERIAGGVEVYRPISSGPSGETVLPSSQANEMEDALLQLKDEIGNFDEYVREKLGYDTISDLHKGCFAEQVDGLALAIYNIENGEGMIIGDQTGVGKGGIAAGVLMYAHNQGLKPIFITKDATLYTDIYRDLSRMGKADLKPFIMNATFPNGQRTTITDPDGKVLYEADPAVLRTALREGNIPEEYDLMVMSYTQINTDKKEGAVARRKLFSNLSRGSIVVMDESHQASGQSNTGVFLRKELESAKGAVFLSATYAKRPDNLALYSAKTVMREAGLTDEELSEAIKAGGPALMEIISSQLVESMQFIRRERSMEGIPNNWVVYGEDPATGKILPEGEEMIRKYDQITEVIRDIIEFQDMFVNPIIKQMKKKAKQKNQEIKKRGGTASMGINNTVYFSKVYNVIQQLLFAIKAPYVVEDSMRDLAKGRKPFIVFTNTMEAMLNDMLDQGLVEMNTEISTDFAYVLEKGLRGTMVYTSTSEEGIPSKEQFDPSDLGENGQKTYYSLIDRIKEMSSGIPISPIDVMRTMFEEKGVTFLEVTGRDLMIEYTTPDFSKGKIVRRKKGNKTDLVRQYNNTPNTVMAGNTAIATGLSAHSSIDFKDQSVRAGKYPQPNPEINTYMQALGRINRAGQVNLPIFDHISSVIPAEKRLMMMTKQKLGLLDASTTSNQKQSDDRLAIVDFFNKYGDQVIAEYLEDNPEVNRMIGDPLGLLDDSKEKPAEPHRKVTNEISIVPTKIQESFYEDVINRYKTHMDFLNSQDMNDLEVKTMDLQAESISKDLIVQGRGGRSRLGDDSHMEIMEINSLRKPMTIEEINNNVQKELAGRTGRDYVSDLYDKFYKGAREKVDQRLKDMNDHYDIKVKDEHDLYEKKVKDGKDELDARRKRDENIERIEDTRKTRHDGLVDIHTYNVGFVKNTLGFFIPGEVYEVPFDSGEGSITRMNKGMVIGYEFNDKVENPYVLSNLKLKFATQDSRKAFSVPLSKNKYINTIKASSMSLSQREKDTTKENWNTASSGKARVKRFIVTGNILQAFASHKGQLIEFTMKNGTVQKGILMPENFDYKTSEGVSIGIKDAANIIKALAEGDYVETTDGRVSIHRGVPWSMNRYASPGEIYYTVKVPSSREKGRKYWDPAISNLPEMMNRGEFSQTEGKMVGIFPEQKMQDVLDELDKHRLTIVTKNHNVSRSQPNSAEAHFGQTSGIKERHQDTEQAMKDADEKERERNQKIVMNDTGMTDRIAPSPISGVPPKKLWEIQAEIPKKFKRPVRYGTPRSKKAAGTYSPGEGLITLRYNGDLDVTAHELGHLIDDLFGLVGPDFRYKFPDFQTELDKLSQWGSKPDKNAPKEQQEMYKRAEGVAEYLRAWMINPAEAEAQYPRFTEWFKDRVEDEMLDIIREFGDDIRAWVGSTDMEKIGANLGSKLEDKHFQPLWARIFAQSEGNPIGMRWRWSDKFIWGWSNDQWPWMKAAIEAMKVKGIAKGPVSAWNPENMRPSENPLYVGSLLPGHTEKVVRMMTDGISMPSGNILYDTQSPDRTRARLTVRFIMEPLDKTDQGTLTKSYNDALRFMVAERAIEYPWKMEDKQMRLDLEQFEDKLPPMEVLDRHPNVRRRYQGKIEKVLNWALENEIPESELFLPIERYTRFEDDVSTGIGGGIFRDIDVARGAYEEAKADPVKFEMYKEFARRYRAYADGVMMYALQSGLIKREAYEFIKETNTSYVMLQRMMNTDPTEIVMEIAGVTKAPGSLGGGDAIGLVKDPSWTHAFEGSSRGIKDPVDQIMNALYNTVQNADKNHFMVVFTDLFKSTRDMYDPQTNALSDLGRRVPYKTKNSVSLKRLGYEEHWEFDPVVKTALTETVKSLPIPVIKQFADVFRFGIVNNVVFALRNVERDVPWNWILNPHPYKLRHWMDPKQQKFASESMDRMGGGQFGWYMTTQTQYYGLMNKAMIDLLENKSTLILDPRYMKTALWDKGYMEMLKAGERWPRMATFSSSYEALKKKGKTKDDKKYSEQDAMIYGGVKARKTMDYHVAGHYIRQIMTNTPFLNPKIRGLVRSVWAFRSDPYGTFLRLGILSLIGTALQTALLLQNKYSKDVLKEYKQFKPWRRDLFYNFPTPGGGWVTIPRAFDIGILTSATQRVADKLILGDDRAFENYLGRTLFNLVMPFGFTDMTSAVSGPVIAITKKDYFRDRYIIPPEEQKTDIRTRNTERASEFGKDIQDFTGQLNKKLGGSDKPWIDARMVDAFTQAQGGYFGKQGLDTYQDAYGGDEDSYFGWDWSDTGQFKYSNIYQAKDVQYVLEKAQEYPHLYRDPGYRAFKDQVSKYFETDKGTKQRTNAGVELMDYATNLRSQWEERDMFEEWQKIQNKESDGKISFGKQGTMGPTKKFK